MKKKLKLSNLKVQSFVTQLNIDDSKTVKGGDRSATPECATEVAACQFTGTPACAGSHVPNCSLGIACTVIDCTVRCTPF
ncbi:MAG: hypothetical protein JWO09_2809 [Bacteroidetes bacterium]|nr:hypothetical protein [Bacteroidota bacterium]